MSLIESLYIVYIYMKFSNEDYDQLDYKKVEYLKYIGNLLDYSFRLNFR